MDTLTTVEHIRAKVLRGDALTPWERSTYRLNYRPDGSRYSADPKERDRQYEEDINAHSRELRSRRR